MSNSWIINGLMIFFLIAMMGAFTVPLLLLPKWLEGAQAKRAAFHAAAIDVLTAEMARPQAPGQAARLTANRRFHVAALQALAPHAVIAPVRYDRELLAAA